MWSISDELRAQLGGLLDEHFDFVDDGSPTLSRDELIDLVAQVMQAGMQPLSERIGQACELMTAAGIHVDQLGFVRGVEDLIRNWDEARVVANDVFYAHAAGETTVHDYAALAARFMADMKLTPAAAVKLAIELTEETRKQLRARKGE